MIGCGIRAAYARGTIAARKASKSKARIRKNDNGMIGIPTSRLES
jgi:hypothetical protein